MFSRAAVLGCVHSFEDQRQSADGLLLLARKRGRSVILLVGKAFRSCIIACRHHLDGGPYPQPTALPDGKANGCLQEEDVEDGLEDRSGDCWFMPHGFGLWLRRELRVSKDSR